MQSVSEAEAASRVYDCLSVSDRNALLQQLEGRLEHTDWKQNVDAMVQRLVDQKLSEGHPLVISNLVSEVVAHAQSSIPESTKRELCKSIQVIVNQER